MKQVEGNQQLVPTEQVSPAMDIELDSYAWRRMPGEPATSYAYFKMYLAQDKPRNISRLARHLRKHGQSLRNFSGKFKWIERAAAYDQHITGKQVEIQRRQNERRELEWLDRRDEQRQQEWEIAQMLMDKVRQMLSVPLFAERVEEILEGLDPEGRIIIRQVIHFEPLDWSATDIARFFDIAGKMGRLATGMDTDQKKLRIDVSALTDAELEALANQT